MNITTENKKQKAIELMGKLDIYKPYIKGFRENNKVCFFENFGGFWAEQEPELMAKMNIIALCTLSLTSFLSLASVTTSFTYPTTKKIGKTCSIRKAIRTSRLLTFGTKQTIGAASLAQLASARSAVEFA